MDYRFRRKVTQVDQIIIMSTDRHYMNVPFHNKGMDMIDLPRILNSKRVVAIPNYLKDPTPIINYMYTRMTASKYLAGN